MEFCWHDLTFLNSYDLSSLSDEEREALEGEDVGTLDDAEAAARVAEQISDTDAGADPAPADPEPPAAELEDEPLAPRLMPPTLEGVDEQLNELLDQRKGIREQYRNGDIAAEDKDRLEDEINDKIADIRAARQNAQFVETYNQQMAEQDYLRTLKDVKAEIKSTDGIDYDKNPLLLQNWDLRVRALASDPANADKPAAWYLKEAHKQVLTEVEATVTALGFKRDKPAPRDPVRDAVQSRRPPDTRAKSLAALPAAAQDTGRSDAEFSHLDRLDGDDLEAAVARMTPDQQERWARQ